MIAAEKNRLTRTQSRQNCHCEQSGAISFLIELSLQPAGSPRRSSLRDDKLGTREGCRRFDEVQPARYGAREFTKARPAIVIFLV